MGDVRHTYLHYLIEPLLYQRATAMDRFLPILKDVRDAPLEYVYRWTNDFDPAALAGLRELFDAAGSPEDILQMLRCKQNSLPN